MSELEIEGFIDAAAEAKQAGLEVLVASDYELYLDLDTREARVQYAKMKIRTLELYPATKIESWKSKSGNTHRRITLVQPRDTILRVGLQLALGSDPMKELLTLARLDAGFSDGLIRLFRPPTSAILVEYDSTTIPDDDLPF